MLGKELVYEPWNTKLAEDTLDYGRRLMEVADKIAKENDLEYLKERRVPQDTVEDLIEWKLHIVLSLAKWLKFYSKNRYGSEAVF